MKTLYRYSLPFTSPLLIKGHTYAKREGLILAIDGKGYGEISPFPHWSQESLEEAEKEIISYLKGEKEATLPSVSFGISSALIPQRFSKKIPVSALLWGSAEETLSLAEKAHKSGFQTCKAKLNGFPIAEAVEIAKTIRKKYPKMRLRTDSNKKWSLKEALYFAKHFEAKDFDYLEDPLSSWEEMMQFSKETHFPVAVDEFLLEKSTHEVLSLPSLKAAVVKPSLFGGLEACQKLKKELQKKGSSLILSSAFESGVGIFSMAKFAEKLEISEAIGIDTYRYLKEDVIDAPLDFSNGLFSSSTTKLKKLCPIFSVP
jgi:o-succinylbenzoate synthase